MDVLNYQCPNCSAGLTFDSRTQKMVCEYCGSSFSVEELEALKEKDIQESMEAQKETQDDENHWEGFGPEQWQASDMQGMKVWNCPACGAEIIAEETRGAMKCPYCDNPMVIPEQFSGMYLPDYVIPFKKSGQEALEALKKHYMGKPLLPKEFTDPGHMEEIQAVYVPFWLFDLEAGGDFRYEGTRTRYYEDHDYRYTETSFYDILRVGNMKFMKIPVDGSRKIDDTLMEAIEPYHYEDLQPFQISYLSGYLADKYDVEPDELTDRLYTRMEKSVKEGFRSTVGPYETLKPKREKISIAKRNNVKYGLFPVWFLNTKWNGKTYSFVMNGQTGKLIGDLPVGKDLVKKYWFRVHIRLTLIGAGLLFLGRLLGVI